MGELGTWHFGPMAGDADMPAVSRLVHHAFASPIEGCEQWLRGAGLEHMRVLREHAGAAPGACLLRIPMGQYFGGRSVPMLGIAAVAVGPENRGQGLAKRLMQEAAREAARDEFPIACLYASTQSLYRQIGYEQAGHRFFTTMPLGRIDTRERTGRVRTLTDRDDAAIRACYLSFASAFNGTLDRGTYCWGRVRELRGVKHSGFGIEDGRGGLSGYVFISQQRETKTGYHDLMVSDLAFTTGAAGRRLLGFLADFATTAESVVLPGGPIHPLVSLMSSHHYTVEKKDYWMLRVLDVAAAIEGRGYSPGVSARVVFELTDEVIPANAGRWVVNVNGGRGHAARASDDGREGGGIRCDIRALASMYSGLYSARQLVMMGWLEGDDAAIVAADSMFAGSGGTPWMTEMF